MLVSASLPAQSITAGSLVGFATSEAGAPLRGAQVVLTESGSGRARQMESGDDGRFAFELLPTGEYQILIEILGYKPLRIEGIVVTPGTVVPLRPVLVQTPPPVTGVTVVRAPGGSEAGRAGVSEWFAPFAFTRLPDIDRTPVTLERLSARAGREREVEGLPSRFGLLAADGVPYLGPRHPWIPSPSTEAAALPLSSFERAELITNDADVEYSEFAGSLLRAFSRRGSSRLAVRAFGDWSGSALASSGHFADAPSFTNLRAGAIVSGPVIRDTAHFAIGAEARRVDTPFPAAWRGTGIDSALRAIAVDSHGVNVDAHVGPFLGRTEVISGFGRFDWQLTDRHAVGLRASVASTVLLNPDAPVAPYPSLGADARGLDASAGATLSSVLSSRVHQELRLGFERGRREWRSGAIPFTSIVDSAVVFGTNPGLQGEFQRTTFRLAETVHLAIGAQRLKLGLAGSTNAFDRTHAWGRTASFLFDDADAFAARQGVFEQATGTLPVATFSTHQIALYAQSTWAATSGFDFRFGLRYEVEFLPGSRVPLNQAWADQTGLQNRALDARRAKFSPRVALQWTVADGGWIIRAQSGMYHDQADPEVLAELINNSGRVDVIRAVGTLGSWPAGPAPAATAARKRLTMLGPEFDAPRTSRSSLGITRRIGTSAALHVSTTYRHTDFLPRRVDLNRHPVAAWEDQYGRPVYGELTQLGSIVTVNPPTNRRFPDFDLVSALNVDGFSNYADVNVSLERQVGRTLNLIASYTFSRTTDNWLTGKLDGPEAQLSPFPEGLDGGDWANGRSDFDLPHRFSLAAYVLPIGREGFSIAAVYRRRSGYPFTPGFRDGVDLNGDGSGRNDPAFVDESIAGVTDLTAVWTCLIPSGGRFVSRNACREPGVSTLDLRLGIGPMRVGSYPIEFVADLLNLTDAESPVVDHALYLVDGNVSLVTDPGTGTVTVPLVANPNFGRPLARRASGRAIRAGFRVNY